MCFAVNCSESITRSTSSKFRPVVIGYTMIELDLLVRADHEHVADRLVVRGGPPVAGALEVAGSMPYSFDTFRSVSPIIG